MKKSGWIYAWPYLVFGVTIGMLVLINTSLIRRSVRENRYNSKTINIAGRQRFLSQLAVSNSLIYLKAGQLPSNAKAAIEKWNEVHFALQTGSEKYGLVKLAYPDVQQEFEKLSPVQHELYKKLSQEKIEDTTIKRILFLQSVYLPIMDRIVFLFEKDAENSLKKMLDDQILVILISGLTLMLEILFVILPYHWKFVYAFRELRSQKSLIEKQNEEIARQIQSLSVQNTELDHLHRTSDLILTAINAGVWNLNFETGEESWSSNFNKLLGFLPNEIHPTLESFKKDILHPDDVIPLQETVDMHILKGDAYRMNIRLKNKNGQYRWYESSGMAVRNAEGKAIQMAGSIIDIDDKIAYEKELESMNKAKDKLFAIIAHDLRSPINNVKSLLELHDEGVLAQKDLFSYFGGLKNSFTFLSETLDNMLAWAVGQMHGLKTNPSVFEINEVIRMADNFYHSLCVQKGIKASYEQTNAYKVFADYNQTYTIIRNLISNAIKFTPNGGKITVTTVSEPGKVKIIIEDTGVGIKQSDIALMLKREEHFTTYGTNNEKGTGLGIGLVLDLLKLNNGAMDIDSEPGKGSRFTITLPAANE